MSQFQVGNLFQSDRTPLLFLGTSKGLQGLELDRQQNGWTFRNRDLEDYDISALGWDRRNPALILAGTATGELFSSQDTGITWQKVGSGLPSRKIWSIVPDPHSTPGSFYLGIEGGHLFYSDDAGASCRELIGYRQIPEAEEWFGPFGPAIFHTILPHPTDPGSLFTGMSVAGIYRSPDRGASWQDLTSNIPRVQRDENAGSPMLADIHKLAQHPLNATRLYATTHYGTFRSDNEAQTWESIGEGLPFQMTRPLALHPQNPDTVYVICHEDAPDSELPIIKGQLQVHRSFNGGKSWESLSSGLPEKANCSVLREALVAVNTEPCSLFLGTNRGQVFASYDEGESWNRIAEAGSSVRVVRVFW